ncbi:MAG: DUF4926 domain-containing protein [Methylococcaceae bacterium]|jgi:hypothetical protein
MKLLDVVALLENIPNAQLYRGQVGTIVEVYEPDIFEVEFCDTQGQTYAVQSLTANQLLLLHHNPLILKEAA